LKILIAEDDHASRKILFKFMSQFGDCDITVDGAEAIEAFILASDEKKPYDLVYLDIMMPKVDGIKVLKSIRKFEKESGINKNVKIILTTALNDTKFVQGAFDNGCDAYAAKPLDTAKLKEVLEKLKLV
jgi:two-component system chemotaxis response regulator CheY